MNEGKNTDFVRRDMIVFLLNKEGSMLC